MELKPCPFCGSESKVDTGGAWSSYNTKYINESTLELGNFQYGEVYYARCKNCYTFKSGKSKEEAIEKWNTRADTDLLRRVKEAVGKMVNEQNYESRVREWEAGYRQGLRFAETVIKRHVKELEDK